MFKNPVRNPRGLNGDTSQKSKPRKTFVPFRNSFLTGFGLLQRVKLLKFIEYLEEKRFNIFTAYLYISAMAIIRKAFEDLFFYKDIYSDYFNLFNLRVFFMEIHFFVAFFILWVLIIKWFSKERLNKVANYLLTFWWITIVAPILNKFVFHNYKPIGFVSPEKILDVLLLFKLNQEIIFRGVAVEAVFLAGGAVLYVFLKTRSFFRPFLTMISVYLLMWVSLIQTNLPFLRQGFGLDIWFFFIFFIFILVYGYIQNRTLLLNSLKNVKVLEGIHFIAMAFLGLVISRSFDLRVEPFGIIQGDLRILSNAIRVLLPVLFVWQYTVILHRIFNVGNKCINTPKMSTELVHLSEEQYAPLVFLFALLTLMLGMLSGLVPFLLIVLYLSTATIYSVPPLQMKRYIFSSAFIGLWSSLSFLFGYFSGTSDHMLTPDVAVISVLIFVGLSLGSMVKDLKNYERDRTAGVKNLLTVFGWERGKRIICGFVSASFLIPLGLIREVPDIFFITLLMIATGFLIYIYENMNLVFICYFIVLGYWLLRYQGFINFGRNL